MAHSWGRLPHS
uniref:Uncharacterized protein n=1 Tax=Anguilla anguilla TaxID=7936 RepID=A0A0E9P643_ANGAN